MFFFICSQKFVRLESVFSRVGTVSCRDDHKILVSILMKTTIPANGVHLSLQNILAEAIRQIDGLHRLSRYKIRYWNTIISNYYIKCHLISQFINPRKVISNETAAGEFDINFH